MNRKSYLILALAALASLLLLASCSKGGKTDDTTSADTSKETEAVTAIPRYDYMDAEVAPDVQIDRADTQACSDTICAAVMPSGAAMIHINLIFLGLLRLIIFIASMAEPPVASMGSRTITSRSSISEGSLL